MRVPVNNDAGRACGRRKSKAGSGIRSQLEEPRRLCGIGSRLLLRQQVLFRKKKRLIDVKDRWFTFVNVVTLPTLSQEIENQETAIDSKGNRCGIPDEDVTQQVNLGLRNQTNNKKEENMISKRLKISKKSNSKLHSTLETPSRRCLWSRQATPTGWKCTCDFERSRWK